MSTGSKIQWTDHTFNPWWGCTKVHSGCANCYAETWDKRYAGAGGGHWGKDAARRMILGEWGNPAKWNAAAEKAGTPALVFCASMCDLFERFDGPVVDQLGKPVPRPAGFGGGNWDVPTLRWRAFEIMDRTPWLRWLLLTKRPENIMSMVPAAWHSRWPEHVWTGTSPCNQETADACIPALLKVPGRHFLSCEPLLGAIDLGKALPRPLYYCSECGKEKRRADCAACGTFDNTASNSIRGVDWVIAGGESGTGKTVRPFDLAYARSLRDQCAAAGVPFFLKQLGAKPYDSGQAAHVKGSKRIFTEEDMRDPIASAAMVSVLDRTLTAMTDLGIRAPKGDNPAEWPADLQVQQFPDWSTPTPQETP